MKEHFPPDSIFLKEDLRKHRWAIPYNHEALNNRFNTIIADNSTAIKGKRILDLGCHFGTFAYGALKEGASYIHGIDSEESLITKAYNLFGEENLPQKSYKFSCKEIISFLEKEEEDAYDTILCLGVFYYLNDLYHALSQMKRVAREYIIIDTFTAYYGACISKEGETIFNSIKDETFDLPIILFPRTKSKKTDYTLTSSYLSEKRTELSILSLPTEKALQYFFYMLDLSFNKLDWSRYKMNDYKWQDLVDPEVKKVSHWADVYLTGVRVSYLISIN